MKPIVHPNLRNRLTSSKTMVFVRLYDEVIKDFDALANASGMTRSNLLRHAVNELLAAQGVTNDEQ